MVTDYFTCEIEEIQQNRLQKGSHWGIWKTKDIVLRDKFFIVVQERGTGQFCQNAPKWSGDVD